MVMRKVKEKSLFPSARERDKEAFRATLPKPPVPPDCDLRDVPIPANLFIEMAMSQFGITREEASALVYETIARRHGAKGNA
jgi:hypothetical protein